MSFIELATFCLVYLMTLLVATRLLSAVLLDGATIYVYAPHCPYPIDPAKLRPAGFDSGSGTPGSKAA